MGTREGDGLEMSLEERIELLQKQLIDNLNSENKRYDELNKKVKAIETQTKEQYKRGDKIFNDFNKNKFDNLILFLRELIYKHINKDGDNYGDDIEDLLKMLDKIQLGSEKESQVIMDQSTAFPNFRKKGVGSEKEPCIECWWYKNKDCCYVIKEECRDNNYKYFKTKEHSEKEELEVIKPDIKLEMIMKEFCEVCHHKDNCAFDYLCPPLIKINKLDKKLGESTESNKAIDSIYELIIENEKLEEGNKKLIDDCKKIIDDIPFCTDTASFGNMKDEAKKQLDPLKKRKELNEK